MSDVSILARPHRPAAAHRPPEEMAEKPFQSSPDLIGRARRATGPRTGSTTASFNPRPTSSAGRPRFLGGGYRRQDVSILARPHRPGARQSGGLLHGGLGVSILARPHRPGAHGQGRRADRRARFQSSPDLIGRAPPDPRIPEAAKSMFQSSPDLIGRAPNQVHQGVWHFLVRFNPRPTSSAGRPSARSVSPSVVGCFNPRPTSSAGRHDWRCGCEDAKRSFNPRPTSSAGALGIEYMSVPTGELFQSSPDLIGRAPVPAGVPLLSAGMVSILARPHRPGARPPHLDEGDARAVSILARPHRPPGAGAISDPKAAAVTSFNPRPTLIGRAPGRRATHGTFLLVSILARPHRPGAHRRASTRRRAASGFNPRPTSSAGRPRPS